LKNNFLGFEIHMQKLFAIYGEVQNGSEEKEKISGEATGWENPDGTGHPLA